MALVNTSGEPVRQGVPKAKGVRPFGSKILVEVLDGAEILGSTLHLAKGTQVDGAPQAYITALGPSVPAEAGLAVGMRVYWTGRGTTIENPACSNERVNAMLEVSNILGIIDE